MEPGGPDRLGGGAGMSKLTIHLRPCPNCDRDLAAPFLLSGMGQGRFFIMCDPKRGGCGKRTEGSDTILYAAEWWQTAEAEFFLQQERLSA